VVNLRVGKDMLLTWLRIINRWSTLLNTGKNNNTVVGIIMWNDDKALPQCFNHAVSSIFIEWWITFYTGSFFLFFHLTRPTTTATLITIDGFSEKMCERFGHEIVDFVSKYCKDNDLSADKTSSLHKVCSAS
jgi:hypothetical protein